MSSVKGLRLIVRLQERRLASSEEVARARDAALTRSISALQQQQEREAIVCAEEAAQRKALSDTLSAPKPIGAQDILSMKWFLTEAEQQSAQARQETAHAQADEQSARALLREARLQVKRNEHQVGVAQGLLEEALQEVQRAQDDTQDEEAEETAVARMIAASRAAKALRPETAARARQR
jgi:Bacterial type III secretion protein (HrpB7)